MAEDRSSSTGFSARPYQDQRDLEDIYTLLAAGRLANGDWRYWHMGELAFNVFMIECHLSPSRQIRLWHAADGALAAYAMLGEDPTYDYQVHPAYEGQGLETQALAWGLGLLAELRQEDPENWGGELACSARLDDRRRIAFLETHGFRTGVYTEVNLLGRLDGPLPAPDPPPGWQVRAVQAGEVAARTELHRLVWQPWTVGEITPDQYTHFTRLPGFRRDLDLVAVNTEGVLGAYVNGWIDPLNHIGDFGPVGAHPNYRRQGLTRAVLQAGMQHMQALGMERVCISTGIDNQAAWGLYQSVGCQVLNQTHTFLKPWQAATGITDAQEA